MSGSIKVPRKLSSSEKKNVKPPKWLDTKSLNFIDKNTDLIKLYKSKK